jgi:phospholipid/cholesterol/gamma-HCH transport system ATP-binding protein
MVSSPESRKIPGTPLIVIDQLGIEFGRQAVLREISLQIPRGETIAIIGESGCGKTVLLKSIIGLLRAGQGDVWFDGENISTASEHRLAEVRTRFGFLFQHAALFDSMTVAQNVAFPLRQHTRKPEEEVRSIVLSRLGEVGLPENVVAKKPAELSGGMRKRVGLARALTLEPEVILYDEPTTGLDPIMSDVINELIAGVRQRRPVTSVVVTHDMRTVRKVADRVVMLFPLGRLRPQEPQIIYDGPADQVDSAEDPRVWQFAKGEAGERLMEMRLENGRNNHG